MGTNATVENDISKILVLGGGTAGFLTALTLKRRLPGVQVVVVHSSRLGVIGVGEGSLRQLPAFLHGYLGIDPKRFFDEVRPTWKLGIRFLWGERGDFDYSFSPQLDVMHPHPDLQRPLGFYCFEEMSNHCVSSVLMRRDSVYLRNDKNLPEIGDDVGYHLDNQRFAGFLETWASEQGIEIIDDELEQIVPGNTGIERLRLASGRVLDADFFVDCSGFKSLLLSKHLGEPFQSYSDSLYCDSAVIGGWQRTDEPLHPYTTCETMPAGWSWQIEHEEQINRGYVFSSDFLSENEADAQFRQANPQVGETRIVRFKAGRYSRAWVDNVVAIGNAAGFVEPLEATAIAAICSSARTLAESLLECRGRPGPSIRRAYNEFNARSWDSIADFLAVHYRFNGLLDTPFWRACRSDVNLRGAQPIVDYYRDNGPSVLWRNLLEDPFCRFKLDGYYTLLVGQKVPHAHLHSASAQERNTWQRLRQATAQYAARGFTVRQALDIVRSPRWQWKPEHFAYS